VDTTNHFSIVTLFDQLGLASDKASIRRFIDNHQLALTDNMLEASFWTPSQASFLKEAIEEDSDWVEIVDHLDAELHSTAAAKAS
jgi:uncharacterized protein YfaA (DUF2138 family)